MRVIYSRRATIGSALLRIGTWSSWSHCAIVSEDETSVIEAAAFHGVREIPLAEFLSDKSKFALRGIDVPNVAAAISFARAQIGKPYDYLGVAGIGLHRNWEDDSAWFCCELIEAAAAAGGRQRFINDAWRVTPQQSWMVV